MALVLEDGSGVSNANSYASGDMADSYFEDRGNAAWTAGSDDDKESALVRATQYLDGRYRGKWKGTKASSAQALAWPRANATDEDDLDIASNVIPQVIIRATCEAALREFSEPGSLNPDLERGGYITKEVIGPIETDYSPAAPVHTAITAIDDQLSGVLIAGGTSVSFFSRA